MDYSSHVNTSLNLNTNSLQFIEKEPVKDETSALVEELNRVSSENKKLTEMLTMVCHKYNELHTHLSDYMTKNPSENNNNIKDDMSPSRKRKPETTTKSIVVGSNNSESSSTGDESSKKQRVSKISVRTETCDANLVVKDGYQWRKYGQKVTRDNPCPRAYFKCSFAPTCPVKKKVQRSVEDQSVLVATYDGEHNHPHPSQAEASPGSNRVVSLSPASLSPTGPANTITLDLTKSRPTNEPKAPARSPQFLVEQMASSLTKDPNFTAALVAAISGKFRQ